MSLIELFKSHVSQVSHAWHRNELASFYSGFYGRALGLDRHALYHEFHDCMGFDDEALFYWGQAIKHFNRDGWPQFKEDESRAIELSNPLFEKCTTNNKFNIALAEIDQWFGDFWAHEDALVTMVDNIKAHGFKVALDVVLLRAAWAIGYYHGAGVAYGRLWTRMMGNPSWNADPSAIYHYSAEQEMIPEVFVDTSDATDLRVTEDGAALFMAEAWNAFYPY